MSDWDHKQERDRSDFHRRCGTADCGDWEPKGFKDDEESLLVKTGCFS